MTASTWPRTPAQWLKDLVFFPIRAAMVEDRGPFRALGLTSLRTERTAETLPAVHGRLLDIGCGENHLVRAYEAQGGRGVGVDVYPWDGLDSLCDTTRLPFMDGSFDTVSFVACLNHIPERAAVLREARRVLAPGGRVLITMIDPLIGLAAHKTFEVLDSDPDCCGRGMQPGETWGLWPSEVEQLLRQAGLQIIDHRRFVYGMNRLFIAALIDEDGAGKVRKEALPSGSSRTS